MQLSCLIWTVKGLLVLSDIVDGYESQRCLSFLYNRLVTSVIDEHCLSMYALLIDGCRVACGIAVHKHACCDCILLCKMCTMPMHPECLHDIHCMPYWQFIRYLLHTIVHPPRFDCGNDTLRRPGACIVWVSSALPRCIMICFDVAWDRCTYIYIHIYM